MPKKEKVETLVAKIAIEVDMVEGKTTCTLSGYDPKDLIIKPLRNYYHMLTDADDSNRRILASEYINIARENGRTLLYYMGKLNWHALTLENIESISAIPARNLIAKFMNSHTDEEEVMYTFGNVSRDMTEFVAGLVGLAVTHETERLSKGKRGTKKLEEKIKKAYAPFTLALVSYVTLIIMGYFDAAREIEKALQSDFFPLNVADTLEAVSETVCLSTTDPGLEDARLH
jgi:hypothetical protein